MGKIIAYYKYQTTKIINQVDDAVGEQIWQRNYHDKIIRNEEEFHEIQRYIVENPLHWVNDLENPNKIL